jgi:Sec-independent protein translocase protein TatA
MGFKLPQNMDELGEMAGKIVKDIRSTINIIVEDIKKEQSKNPEDKPKENQSKESSDK